MFRLLLWRSMFLVNTGELHSLPLKQLTCRVRPESEGRWAAISTSSVLNIPVSQSDCICLPHHRNIASLRLKQFTLDGAS